MTAADIERDGIALQNEIFDSMKGISDLLELLERAMAREDATHEQQTSLTLLVNWSVTASGYLMSLGDRVFHGKITRVAIREARRIVGLIATVRVQMVSVAERAARGS